MNKTIHTYILFSLALLTISCSKNEAPVEPKLELKLITTVGAAGTNMGEFSRSDNWYSPSGMAHDGNYLYVCDEFNHRIQRFSNDTVFHDWIGFKDSVWGKYTDNVPADSYFYPEIIVFREPYMFVMCYWKNKYHILKLSANAEILYDALIVRDPYVFGNYMAFSRFTADYNGNYYFYDDFEIYKHNKAGQQTDILLGKGTTDGKINASSSQMEVDEQNILYAIDDYNNRITKLNADGKFIENLTFTDIEIADGVQFISGEKLYFHFIDDKYHYYLGEFDLDGRLEKKWKTNDLGSHSFIVENSKVYYLKEDILYIYEKTTE